jgi:hypothetical protein
MRHVMHHQWTARPDSPLVVVLSINDQLSPAIELSAHVRYPDGDVELQNTCLSWSQMHDRLWMATATLPGFPDGTAIRLSLRNPSEENLTEVQVREEVSSLLFITSAPQSIQHVRSALYMAQRCGNQVIGKSFGLDIWKGRTFYSVLIDRFALFTAAQILTVLVFAD